MARWSSPNASFALSRGYSSTMQLIFCSSVKSIASSVSLECPQGQT